MVTAVHFPTKLFPLTGIFLFPSTLSNSRVYKGSNIIIVLFSISGLLSVLDIDCGPWKINDLVFGLCLVNKVENHRLDTSWDRSFFFFQTGGQSGALNRSSQDISFPPILLYFISFFAGNMSIQSIPGG